MTDQGDLRRLRRDVERLADLAETCRDNLRDAWAAMALMREAIETLGPVGAMQSSEVLPPTFDDEAQELIRGIQAIADEGRCPPRHRHG